MTSDLDFTDELPGAAPADDPAALLREGLQHHQRGELQPAEALYRRVLEADPEQPDALHFLGLIAHQCGQSDAGIDLMQRSLALRPDNALYHNNLGGIHLQQQRFAEAAAQFERAVELKPDYADAWQHLGEAATGLGRHDDAQAHYARAHSLKPHDPMLAVAHARLEISAGRLDVAKSFYAEAERLAGDNAAALYEIGRQWRGLGEAEQAARVLTRVTDLSPDNADAWLAGGIALADLGRFDEAAARFRRAIQIAPDHVRAYCRLLYGKRVVDPADPDLQALETLNERAAAFPDESRAMIRFALGKAHDDLGAYETAFAHFEAGNKLKRQTLAYDADAHAAFFEAIRERFDADWLKAHQAAGPPDRLPIFIVGMPRSGSSLIEQVLASHRQVTGAGEVAYLRQAIHLELGAEDRDPELPAQLAALNDGALQRIGEDYLSRLRQIAGDRQHVIDKLPGNFALIGLIHALFPDAPIVHCRRDPRDTCLSCYAQLFEIGHEFTYDLQNLARFHREYERTMAHWRQVLPTGRLFDLDYEALVADFEGETRRLLAYCGLDWDPACLAFHQNPHSVRTLSQAQVREPLYQRAVERWRHYERQLAPLLEML